MRIFAPIVTVILFAVSYQGWAQEFWIQPDKGTYTKGDTLKTRFSVGGNFVGETWNLRPEKVKSIQTHQSDKVTELQATEGKNVHLSIPLAVEGSCVVTMQSDPSTIEMPAERFNQYLKEYALDAAISQRKKTNTTDKPGRESYVRNAKLIVQVGSKLDDGYKKVTGLPLEIIPEKNPANYRKGDMVYFKVLFEGKPLFGARAFVWNKVEDRTYTQPIYSQQDGRIEVRLFNDGDWMVSVVTMMPSKDTQTDWRSYWGTLVFHVGE